MKSFFIFSFFVISSLGQFLEGQWNWTASPYTSVDGATVNLGAFWVSTADFPMTSQLYSITFRVIFRKTAGACTNPQMGNSSHYEIGLKLLRDNGYLTELVLTAPGDYDGEYPVSVADFLFADYGASQPFGDVPTSGTYAAKGGSMYSTFFDSPYGNWYLKAEDTQAGSPLCIQFIQLIIQVLLPPTTGGITTGEEPTQYTTVDTEIELSTGEYPTDFTTGDTETEITTGEYPTDITTGETELTTGELPTQETTGEDYTTSEPEYSTGIDVTTGGAQVTTGGSPPPPPDSIKFQIVVTYTADVGSLTPILYSILGISAINFQSIGTVDIGGLIAINFEILGTTLDPASNIANRLSYFIATNEAVLVTVGVLQGCYLDDTLQCETVILPGIIVPPESLCPVDIPTRCTSGICVDGLADCASFAVKCPSSLPYLCHDNTCEVTPRNCVSGVTCPQSDPIMCWDGECVSDSAFCSILASCGIDRPQRCPDGTCVRNDEMCPSDDCFPAQSCPDGLTCVNSISECPPYDGCAPDIPILCPSGECVSDSSDCLCLGGKFRCFDGTCANSEKECENPPSSSKPASISFTVDTNRTFTHSIDVFSKDYLSQLGRISVPSHFILPILGVNVSLGVLVKGVADSILRNVHYPGWGNNTSNIARILSSVISLEGTVNQPYDQSITLNFTIPSYAVSQHVSQNNYQSVIVAYFTNDHEWRETSDTRTVSRNPDGSLTVIARSNQDGKYGVLLGIEDDSGSGSGSGGGSVVTTVAVAVTVSAIVVVGVAIVAVYIAKKREQLKIDNQMDFPPRSEQPSTVEMESVSSM